MTYIIIGLVLVVFILAIRCWYMELVCDQLRTVNEGHSERLVDAQGRAYHAEENMKRFWKFPDFRDGDGI